jgi:hypothetical protein
MDKYHMMRPYAMGLSDQYEEAIKLLENIKYMLRIQNRQEEADLIADAVQRIHQASELFEVCPVQSPAEKE